MTNVFEQREKGFEAKWAHDEDLRFQVHARRNKLLGLWAAYMMGLRGAAAQAYANGVVFAELEKLGEEGVFRKLRGDFDAGHVVLSDRMLHKKMEELLETAKNQIEQEAKK